MSSSSAQVSVSKPLLSRRRCVRRAPTVASALPASADGRRAAVLSLIGAGAAALVASPSNAEEAAPLTALQAYDAMTGANEAPAETNYGELVGGFLGPVVVGVGGVLLFSVFGGKKKAAAPAVAAAPAPPPAAAKPPAPKPPAAAAPPKPAAAAKVPAPAAPAGEVAAAAAWIEKWRKARAADAPSGAAPKPPSAKPAPPPPAPAAAAAAPPPLPAASPPPKGAEVSAADVKAAEAARLAVARKALVDAENKAKTEAMLGELKAAEEAKAAASKRDFDMQNSTRRGSRASDAAAAASQQPAAAPPKQARAARGAPPPPKPAAAAASPADDAPETEVEVAQEVLDAAEAKLAAALSSLETNFLARLFKGPFEDAVSKAEASVAAAEARLASAKARAAQAETDKAFGVAKRAALAIAAISAIAAAGFAILSADLPTAGGVDPSALFTAASQMVSDAAPSVDGFVKAAGETIGSAIDSTQPALEGLVKSAGEAASGAAAATQKAAADALGN